MVFKIERSSRGRENNNREIIKQRGRKVDGKTGGTIRKYTILERKQAEKERGVDDETLKPTTTT